MDEQESPAIADMRHSSANAQNSIGLHLCFGSPLGWFRRNFATPISHRKPECWGYQLV